MDGQDNTNFRIGAVNLERKIKAIKLRYHEKKQVIGYIEL